MPMIEVSFDTYKELTMRRANESVTYDDVVRKLLKLPPIVGAQTPERTKKSWTYKGVTFPHGTELRANYKGALHTAKIDDGEWIQEGKTRNSPSEAAHAITKTSINGWTFWEARLPGEDRWRILKSMR
jgi:hypothetical protein